MESRFGVKDFVLVALLLVLIVLVGLSSCGYNRQWESIKAIEKQLSQQNEQIAQLARSIRTGAVSLGNGSGPLGNPGFDRELAAHAKPDYAEGDWFVDAYATNVGKLTPLVSSDVYQDRIAVYVLDSLIDRDPQTLEWIPRLATDWQVSEDGLTFSFDLRPDAVFSDGVPLTAADVIFTYEWIMNPDINCPRMKTYYENVESVVAEGPHRVVFRMKEPYFLSLSVTGGIQVMAKHYYSQFTPEEFNESAGLLFGSGPYKLDVDPKEWTPSGSPIKLVRNENYWGPRPSFDQIHWHQIIDDVARQTSFRNGEVDVYLVPPDQYNKLKTDENLQERGKLYEYDPITGGYIYIGWNEVKNDKATYFADKRVRQALSMLIDRDKICDQILSGLGTPASGPFHPDGDQVDPSIKPWPFDPTRARALLQEAGFKDNDNNGVLEGPDGNEFKFKLTYSSNNVATEQIVLFLRDTFAEAGIVLEPDPLEWTIMLQRLDERNFDAITLGWGGSVEGDPKQMFHSESISGGGDNYISYRSSAFDSLVDKARITVDDEERQKLWQEIHRVLHEDQPYAFLFTRKVVVYVDKRIKNVEATRTGLNPRTEMYVPADAQRWSE